jgi:N-acetylmuramoyl-L-alanine amidase
MSIISLISKRREVKQRETILKGIYEDNLRIVGLMKSSLAKKKPFFLKKSFISVIITLIAILAHQNYFSASFSPEKDMLASLDMKESSYQPIVGTANLAEYNAFFDVQNIPLSRMFGLDVKTIMIDAGHGGSDTGAIGRMGTKEKDIVLDIAKRLNRRLRKYGNYNVLMTRNNDKTLSLHERVELSRISRADLFISVHLNFLPKKPINIIETFYFGPSADKRTLKLAEKENSGSQFGLSEFREMIEKMGNTLKLQESRELAYSIQKSLFVNRGRNSRNIYDYGVKRAPFVVLLGVDVPSVLAEVSCLSNREEETKLNTERHRENIARSLEAGILDYLNRGKENYEAKRREQ